MRWGSFLRDGKASWGLVTENGIVDAGARQGGTLGQAIRDGGLEALGAQLATAAADVTAADVEWLPVMSDAPRYFCVGLNYKAHQEETGRDPTDRPMVFMRFNESQVGHGQALEKPPESDDFDFEGEIAVVIGTGGRRISRDKALDHILGFAPFNDGSIRDYQRHTSQYTAGKNFEKSGSFGPWMMTADEVGDFDSMEIITRLNGEVMQQSQAELLIFGFAELIEFISTFTSLLPGDVIVSGTPGGVGAARTPPVFMKVGDLIEVEVKPIGTLSNRIVQG